MVSDSAGSCAAGQSPTTKATTGSGVLTLSIKGHENNVGQWCPTFLLGAFSYTHNTGSVVTCNTASNLDVCANWTTLTFDYAKCPTIQAFSDGNCSLPNNWDSSWIDSGHGQITFNQSDARIVSGWSVTVYGTIVSSWTCQASNLSSSSDSGYSLFK
uniref:Uncharacterized protein n=1 Tax=Magallana gigas TaxID=29159 RepID=K1QKL4_MAGGI